MSDPTMSEAGSAGPLATALAASLRRVLAETGAADSASAARLAVVAAADPALRHLANAEPWYRSRVTLGALVSLASPVLALALGRTLTDGDEAEILNVLAALGAALGAATTLYGRWVARRPIGA